MNNVDKNLLAVSSMPAPTWHRLKVSSTQVSIPGNLEENSQVEMELDGVSVVDENAFDEALYAFQATIPDTGKAPRAVDEAALNQEEPGNLDIPALSTYQRKAVLQELKNSVVDAFETGMGEEAYAYIRKASVSVSSLKVEQGKSGSATMRIIASESSASCACIDVVAAPESELNLTISFEGEKGSGLAGCGLRVFAGAGARVNIESVQALTGSYTVLDNSGFVLAENAYVTVGHRVLGGSETFTGLSADLRGDGCRMDVSTHYIGAAKQQRDFNYSVKQRGCNTESNMDANGVLAGASKKTLRGTIDFVYGCKGSVGNERETVLLADDEVQNKTVPVILCDEDDVMGNHGATIGHVRPEQRFYLNARGFSEKAIESLFSVAALEEAYVAFPDERIRKQVSALASERGIDAADFENDGEEVA